MSSVDGAENCENFSDGRVREKKPLLAGWAFLVTSTHIAAGAGPKPTRLVRTGYPPQHAILFSKIACLSRKINFERKAAFPSRTECNADLDQ
jgi:hypothetical protein